MRKILVLLFPISILVLHYNAGAQENRTADATANQVESRLSLHLELTGQSYCHADDDSFAAYLDLKLHFTNLSDRTVILSRKIEPPSIVRVARNAQAAAADDFLYAPTPDFFVSVLPQAPAFGDAPDPNLFVVLAAEQSFETTAQVAVFGASNAAKAKREGLLAKGNYALQVGVLTWPYEWPYFTTKADLQVLKRRWAKYGDLATGYAYSDPASFTLPEHFNNPPCKLKR